MPVIFHKRDGRWDAERISSSSGFLSLAPVRFDPSCDVCSERPSAGLLVRIGGDGPWVLLVHSGQRLMHNAQIVTAAIRVLMHMDSLALDRGQTVYFSTEEAARIEPFPANGASCPRCRSEIAPGQPAVRCPGCGVFHHEMNERNCWTYSPTCTLCPHSTVFDAGLQWTPEAL